MDKRFNRLHKQRRRRHPRVVVLNDEELARHFDCSLDALAEHLEAIGVGYHRDSRGTIWASLKLDDSRAPP